MVGDVESFTLVCADGQVRRCSRSENAELFSLVIGGYGLFGVITSVRLRLGRRRKLERVVEVRHAEEIAGAFAERIRDGYPYGDFQFETDETSPTFLTRGVFACYRRVPEATPMPERQAELAYDDWMRLLHLGHVNKAQAFDLYSRHYSSTSGQLYWTDTNQLSLYPDGYHRLLDVRMKAATPGSEMITEVYVPRDGLFGFLQEAAAGLRREQANVIYGTVRLIERDEQTFLPWAREAYACIVFNLHVAHSASGIAGATRSFRLLIDLAERRGGNYYLTYHRWATREQLLRGYPQMPDFLRAKREYDPEERFQSDWYRHQRSLLADAGEAR
jgi:FAD/FMN-containing dehydrogenase